MIKVVMFDLDGTLVNAFRAVHASINHTIVQFGVKPKSLPTIRRAVGFGDKHLLAQFVGEANKEKAIRIYRAHHGDALHAPRGVVFLPQVKSLLKSLKAQGLTLAIVTNRPQKFTLMILKILGIRSYFDMVMCADTSKMPKPKPGMILAVLKRKRVKKNEALYVGDMDIDINTGKKAGVKTVAVSTGSCSVSELKALHPYQIISTIGQLKMTIKAINRS